MSKTARTTNLWSSSHGDNYDQDGQEVNYCCIESDTQEEKIDLIFVNAALKHPQDGTLKQCKMHQMNQESLLTKMLITSAMSSENQLQECNLTSNRGHKVSVMAQKNLNLFSVPS